MNCCSATPANEPCCRVEAVITVDERGQMVLPKEIREKAGIQAGDKLALISWGQSPGIACLALIKATDLNGLVKQMLGPVFKETFK